MNKQCNNCPGKNGTVREYVLWGKKLTLCDKCLKITIRLKNEEVQK